MECVPSLIAWGNVRDCQCLSSPSRNKLILQKTQCRVPFIWSPKQAKLMYGIGSQHDCLGGRSRVVIGRGIEALLRRWLVSISWFGWCLHETKKFVIILQASRPHWHHDESIQSSRWSSLQLLLLRVALCSFHLAVLWRWAVYLPCPWA